MNFDEELFGNLDDSNISTSIAGGQTRSTPAILKATTNLLTTKPKQNGITIKSHNFSQLIEKNTSSGFKNLFSNVSKRPSESKLQLSPAKHTMPTLNNSCFGSLFCKDFVQTKKLNGVNLLSRSFLPSDKLQNYIISLNFETKPFLFDSPEPILFDVDKLKHDRINNEVSILRKPDVFSFPKTATKFPKSQSADGRNDRSQLLKVHSKIVTSQNFKQSITIAIIGNTSSGKSTLLGQILRQKRFITDKILSKLKWESTKMHNNDFGLAWVVDDSPEEKLRMTTLYSSHVCFETNSKKIIAHDTPSRADLLSQTIRALYQSDAVVLLLDGSVNAKTMKSQFSSNSCLNNYLKLIWWLKIKHLIIVVNKMDLIEWNNEKYKALVMQLSQFTNDLELDSFKICAISAIDGVNIVESAEFSNGESLFDCIDQLPNISRNVDSSFRFSVSNIFTPTGSGSFAVEGRVEAGGVSCGVNSPTAQLVSPDSLFSGSVKSIRSSASNSEEITDSVGDINLTHAFAGDYVTLVLTNGTQPLLRQCSILCERSFSTKFSQQFYAEIRIFDDSMPIIPGYASIFHYFSSDVPCVVEKLCQAKTNLGKPNETVITNPRYLLKGMSCTVILRLEETIAIESSDEFHHLNKFVLLNMGRLAAVGLIFDTNECSESDV